jgi:hypothetical protein
VKRLASVIALAALTACATGGTAGTSDDFRCSRSNPALQTAVLEAVV